MIVSVLAVADPLLIHLLVVKLDVGLDFLHVKFVDCSPRGNASISVLIHKEFG